jgi:tripartite-type tricarboxylate transporter receptor subunit TctC
MKKLIAAVTVALACSSAFAQQYPNRPIRPDRAVPAGGAAELGARIFSQPLGQQLGQPVIIETKPGAEGIIASELVKQAAPGRLYAVLRHGNRVVLRAGGEEGPALRSGQRLHADFAGRHIRLLRFLARQHAGAHARRLIGYARANPGKLNYGTGNATSILATGLFAAQQKLDMVHIPYKGDGPLSHRPDRRPGECRDRHARHACAAGEGRQAARARHAAAEPQPLLPTAPTMAEAGVVNVPITPWGGLFGPAEDAEGDRRSRRARTGDRAGQSRGEGCLRSGSLSSRAVLRRRNCQRSLPSSSKPTGAACAR